MTGGQILESILRWSLVSLSLGLLYVLFSLGLTLIFGFHEVVNFAHGAFYMLGAFIALYLYTLTGSFIFALLGSLVLVMILAATVERYLISRLYKADPANNFLLTFAFGLFLVGLVKLIAGSVVRNFPVPKILTGILTVGALSIPVYRIFFIIVAILTVYSIHLLLTKTMIGTIIRAGTANRPAVEVLGVNVTKHFTLLFAIGSGLAAFSAVLTAPLLSIYPTMGDDIILWAFVIVIIGGIGSFKGAVIAGLLIGLLHGVGGVFLGPTSLLLTFIILIAVLLIKPEGFLGIRRT